MIIRLLNLDSVLGTTSPNQNESTETGHGHSHGQPGSGQTGLRSMAWMVVVGDGIHNLTDGLAIGKVVSNYTLLKVQSLFKVVSISVV